MCMIDDTEGWKVHSEVERTARKPHKCGECQREIAVGEKYLFAKGLPYDGDGWEQFKTCLQCRAAAKWLVNVCSGYLYNGVLEELEEHWEENASYHSLWLGRAIIGMRRKWKRSDGSMMPQLPDVPRRVLVMAGAA